MGRGLSELQRCILELAEKKNPATYRDILVGHFGWKILPIGRARWYGEGYRDCPNWFDEEAIGPQRYQLALASISRSCTRLCRRGLIDRKVGRMKFGVTVHLTQAGHELLSVKKL